MELPGVPDLALAPLPAGFLCSGVGQHLLYQPDVCPGEPLGGCAARDPGRAEPDADSHAHLRETSEEGEMSGDARQVPSGELGRQEDRKSEFLLSPASANCRNLETHTGSCAQ